MGLADKAIQSEVHTNLVPLRGRDRIYGGWWDYHVLDAKSAVQRSAERYIKAIDGSIGMPGVKGA